MHTDLPLKKNRPFSSIPCFMMTYAAHFRGSICIYTLIYRLIKQNLKRPQKNFFEQKMQLKRLCRSFPNRNSVKALSAMKRENINPTE